MKKRMEENDKMEKEVQERKKGCFKILIAMILNSSVCRAFEIIQNDTKIVTIPWGSTVKNKFWDFCVGDYVGFLKPIKTIDNLKKFIQNEMELYQSHKSKSEKKIKDLENELKLYKEKLKNSRSQVDTSGNGASSDQKDDENDTKQYS